MSIRSLADAFEQEKRAKIQPDPIDTYYAGSSPRAVQRRKKEIAAREAYEAKRKEWSKYDPGHSSVAGTSTTEGSHISSLRGSASYFSDSDVQAEIAQKKASIQKLEAQRVEAAHANERKRELETLAAHEAKLKKQEADRLAREAQRSQAERDQAERLGAELEATYISETLLAPYSPETVREISTFLPRGVTGTVAWTMAIQNFNSRLPNEEGLIQGEE